MMSATTSAPTWHAVKHCVCASCTASTSGRLGGAPKSGRAPNAELPVQQLRSWRLPGIKSCFAAGFPC